MRSGRIGFTLTETVFCAALFMVAFFATFTVFDLGSYHFHVGLMRQGIQNDVRKAWLNLDHDLRHAVPDGILIESAGRNVTVPFQNTTITVGRHIVSMPSLSNWQPNATTFDPTTGLPRWDRYIFYQATLDTPDGDLYRLETQPPNVPFNGESFTDFSLAVAALNATVPTNGSLIGGAQVLNVRRIAGGVLSFEVTSVLPQIRAVLKLRGKLKAEGAQAGREDTFEVNLNLTPNNQIVDS